MNPIDKAINPAPPFGCEKRTPPCKQEEFRCRNVKKNQHNGEFSVTTEPESLTSDELLRSRSVELKEAQIKERHKFSSSDQFQAELEEIKTKLSNDGFCFEDIEECKKELTSLVKERTGLKKEPDFSILIK